MEQMKTDESPKMVESLHEKTLEHEKALAWDNLLE